jgi:hypothetical protein
MIFADPENSLSGDIRDVCNLASDLLDPDVMRRTSLSTLLGEDFSKAPLNATAKDLLQVSCAMIVIEVLMLRLKACSTPSFGSVQDLGV